MATVDMPQGIFEAVRCLAGGVVYDVCKKIFGADACKAVGT